MKKPVFYRILFYVIGLLVLALGLTLNTKTGLGVSPIISVAYSISEIFDQNFGNMTLALYSLFVVIEMILHLIRTGAVQFICRDRDDPPSDPQQKIYKDIRRSTLPCRQDRSEAYPADGFSADSAQSHLHTVSERFFRGHTESLFRPAEHGGRDGRPCGFPYHRYHPDRHRSRHVTEYAHRAESRRRHRSGNR